MTTTWSNRQLCYLLFVTMLITILTAAGCSENDETCDITGPPELQSEWQYSIY